MPKYGYGGTNSAKAIFIAGFRPNDGFPSRWYGFDSADVVVLNTNDPAVMARVANQSQGLREWVRQGGHLVVAIGQAGRP